MYISGSAVSAKYLRLGRLYLGSSVLSESGILRTLSLSVFDYFCRMVLFWKKKTPDSTASVLDASALL